MGRSKTPELTALKISRIMKEAFASGKRSQAREKNPDWKGGITRSHSAGYVRIRLIATDPFYAMCDRNGYVYEHRLQMARQLGRVLSSKENVHHRDRNTGRNTTENLKLLSSNSEHTGIHQVPTYIFLKCNYCGKPIKRLLWRVMKSATNRFYCNNSCQANNQYKNGVSVGKQGFYPIPPLT